MSTYIIAVIFASVMLLFAALISNAIKFEGGVNPTDPRRRKIWFWVLGILNPILYYCIAAFVMAPTNKVQYNKWMDSLPIATGIGFVLYILLGFVLSRMFKNGKLGNWF
jgi:preprotein translocase subunit SecY